MKKSLVIVLLFMISVMAVNAASLVAPAATVNLIRNKAITMDDLNKEIENYKQAGINMTNQDVLQAMINDEVFAQGAERDGIKIDDRQVQQIYDRQKASVENQAGRTLSDDEFRAIVEQQYGTVQNYKEYIRNQFIINNYLTLKKSDVLQNIPQPSDTDINSFYRQNQQSFFQPESVKLAHIYIPKTGDAAQDGINRKTLETADNQIKAGTLTFEKAVQLYTKDEDSKSVGGDIGYLTASNDEARQGWGDDFVEQVLSMDDGEISPVLESRMGYHIIKVTVHYDAKLLKLTDKVSPEENQTVREYIIDYLMQEKTQEVAQKALEDLVKELRAQAKITVLYK